METTHTAIIDQVGRTIVGKLVSETTETITLNNPVILHCQMEQTGQLNLQTFPLFFFEFIDKTSRDQNDWTYAKSAIVQSNVVLDQRIIDMVDKINTPAPEAATTNPKVISIDDL